MQLRSSIRAQLNLNGSRHETSGTADNKSSFLNLPPEIHLLIFEHLGFPPISSINVAQFPTWAALELTCKAAQAITEPYLYHKIYTNVRDTYAHSGQLRPLAARKRRFDTRSLVKLLRRRSHLVKFVKFLIIDEYDPRALRQLLANDFVKLESLIVQQDDKVLRHVGRKTCERWNHTAKRQAKLKNCKYSFVVLAFYHLFVQYAPFRTFVVIPCCWLMSMLRDGLVLTHVSRILHRARREIAHDVPTCCRRCHALQQPISDPDQTVLGLYNSIRRPARRPPLPPEP